LLSCRAESRHQLECRSMNDERRNNIEAQMLIPVVKTFEHAKATFGFHYALSGLVPVA
jgi:hypothetical protein